MGSVTTKINWALWIRKTQATPARTTPAQTFTCSMKGTTLKGLVIIFLRGREEEKYLETEREGEEKQKLQNS